MVYYILNLFSSSPLIDFNTLEYTIFRIIFAILTSFLICLVFGPWIIKQLSLMQIKQYIRKNGPKSHYKKAGTPTMGGILIILPVFISLIIWSDLKDLKIWILCFTITIFGLIGFIDDYMMQIKKKNKGLTAQQKLILQIISATILSCLIYILPNFDTNLKIPFFNNLFIQLGWIYIPFTIFIIVGTSNAVNLTDGLDGMAIGIMTIVKTAYMFIILITGSPLIAGLLGLSCTNNSAELAIYCAAFIGSGLGFLWFNSYPSQIFMGDVGSLAIGSSLGILAVLSKHEILLVLIGGIFVIETLSVILQVVFFKITKGHRLFVMAPIHHHFELLGISESKIVSRFWIVSIILSIISLISLKF